MCVLATAAGFHLHGRCDSVGDEHSDTIHQLKNVEVAATRQKQPQTMQRLQGEKLQMLSSTSIADALKYFAGVQIKDYGGLGGVKTMNVRSLGSQHVGVFVDGIRINNAQNGTVDLGKYSLSTLETVSLYNGGKTGHTMSPSEYASGATVYLQTRRPLTDSLSVMGGIASFHTYLGRLNLQFNRRGWSGFIDGEYVKSRGDYPFRYKSEYEDTVGRRKNSDIEYFRAEAAAFYKGFSAHLYGYTSQRGCPGGIVRRLSDKYTNIGREWDTDVFAQASWAHTFGTMHNVRINTRYSHEYLRYNTDYENNQNTARVDNHYYANDAYASVAYSVAPLRWLRANVGYDGRMSWLKADIKHFDGVRRFDQKAVADLQFNPLKSLRLSASMLYQHYRDHTYVKAGAADPISKFTPTFNVGYFWRGLSVRGWYKKIFRVPTLNDLYYTQAGNRNLKPEYTRQWNIGAEYAFDHGPWSVSAQADAYINHIDNRIVCLPLKGTYTWSMLNYGKTFCRGVNASAMGQYSRSEWSASLLTSVTIQHDVNRTNPDDEDTYEQPICYSPKFSMGITAFFRWKMLSLTVSDIYVSKRMWSYADPDDILRPYNNVDLKLTGQWRWLRASLEINDLFDVQYEHIPRYPMPGRSFKFTLTYTFGR